MPIPNLSFWVACDNYDNYSELASLQVVPEGFAYLYIVFMQGRFLKSYNLTVKQMGGKKVHKKNLGGVKNMKSKRA